VEAKVAESSCRTSHRTAFRLGPCSSRSQRLCPHCQASPTFGGIKLVRRCLVGAGPPDLRPSRTRRTGRLTARSRGGGSRGMDGYRVPISRRGHPPTRHAHQGRWQDMVPLRRQGVVYATQPKASWRARAGARGTAEELEPLGCGWMRTRGCPCHGYHLQQRFSSLYLRIRDINLLLANY
jgi:hypothetical protein